ncbi:hypothetical protein MLD38_021386 [Melastoma candidum]|uniref:Uncharacterized protein n=1 Tax=Melastoma candidum TaxID=119954 RepID=A0ACB9QFT1_9MYRT|nr:hypothetical protein MLD38_021386 [Melastoma candidum]
MHGLSTLDGFVEISENLAEMIEYIANKSSCYKGLTCSHVVRATKEGINKKPMSGFQMRRTSSLGGMPWGGSSDTGDLRRRRSGDYFSSVINSA